MTLRLVVSDTGPGACHDPDHAGLRRLLTDRATLTDPDAVETSWMGADVEAVHLLTSRLLRENKELMVGRERQHSDGLLFAWSLAFAAFALGVVVTYLIFGGC